MLCVWRGVGVGVLVAWRARHVLGCAGICGWQEKLITAEFKEKLEGLEMSSAVPASS